MEDEDNGEEKHNAELIARACSCFYQMLEALESVVGQDIDEHASKAVHFAIALTEEDYVERYNKEATPDA